MASLKWSSLNVTMNSSRFNIIGLAIACVAWFGLILALGPNTANGSLATLVILNGLFAVSIAISFGWLGVPSFGHAAFFGVGVYSAAILRDTDLNPLLVTMIGAATGAMLGFVISAVAIKRTTHVGFAMLTLAAGQALFEVVSRTKWLGGEEGLSGIPRGSVLGLDLNDGSYFAGYVLVVTAIVLMGLALLRASRLGVEAAAVRQNALRAEALGINTKRVQVAVFAVSAGVAGVAGTVTAQYQLFASHTSFSWLYTGTALVMALIGGVRGLWGPLLGALIYTIGQWRLSQVTDAWSVYVGLVVVAIVLLAPNGLTGFGSSTRLRMKRDSPSAPRQVTETINA